MQKLDLTPTLLIFLAACNSAGPPAGSAGQAMVSAPDQRALYVASADHGAVLRRDSTSGAITMTSVGVEPVRVAASGDRVYATLRGERRVAVLSDDGETLVLQAKIDVGAEPFGLALSADGSRLWVASSLSDRVDEIDTRTLSITRSYSVPHEPRWIALHPSEESLYAGCVRSNEIYRIDLDSGELQAMPLPTNSDSRRVRGDLAVTPDGRRVLIPAMFSQPAVQGWGGPIPGTPSANPVVVVAEVDGDGEIDEEEVNVVILDSPGSGESLNGYPSSITVSADSSFAAVSVEGSGEVVLMPVAEIKDAPLGAQRWFGARIAADAGARSVVLGDDGAMYTWSFIERSLSVHQLGDVPAKLRTFETPAAELAEGVQKLGRTELAPSVLPEKLERGRALFYSTNDGYVQKLGSRISCATCHFDGRDDGLTWITNGGPRQTPSLAGNISRNAPLRWAGDRASIADDAMGTSAGVMGGSGLTAWDADAIGAFIDASREADVPLKGSRSDAVERGRAIFSRPDVGCLGCHNGERMADDTVADMFGHGPMKTRSLIGVAATAPYLMDGSAATLRDVLDRATEGKMGDTSRLSDTELDDLEAFLRSL